MLHWPDGSTFATGRSRYLDRDPGRPSETSSVHVQVEFNGVPVLAMLDTGAAWSVLNAELASDLELFDRDGEAVTISSRLGPVQGKLVRAKTTLVADDGDSLDVDSTVFVSRQWPAGNFIGYAGFLERISIRHRSAGQRVHLWRAVKNRAGGG